MHKILLLVVCTVSGMRLTQAQGIFQNLDFESAQLIFEGSPYPPGRAIATTNALPYWSAFGGTNELTIIPYGPSGSVTPVSLYSQTNGGGGALSGNYSVALSQVAGSINQVGQVPTNAQSLLFEVGGGIVSGNPLTVSLGGQDLSYIAISNALNYTLYGADILPFAGQMETLSFAATLNVGYPGAELDNIQFSTVSIPEPSAISFLYLGSGVLFYVRKRKRFRL